MIMNLSFCVQCHLGFASEVQVFQVLFKLLDHMYLLQIDFI